MRCCWHDSQTLKATIQRLALREIRRNDLMAMSSISHKFSLTGDDVLGFYLEQQSMLSVTDYLDLLPHLILRSLQAPEQEISADLLGLVTSEDRTLTIEPNYILNKNKVIQDIEHRLLPFAFDQPGHRSVRAFAERWVQYGVIIVHSSFLSAPVTYTLDSVKRYFIDALAQQRPLRCGLLIALFLTYRRSVVEPGCIEALDAFWIPLLNKNAFLLL